MAPFDSIHYRTLLQNIQMVSADYVYRNGTWIERMNQLNLLNSLTFFVVIREIRG